MVLERPNIQRRCGKRHHGKGFSREELKKAGMSLTEAVKLHVPVDPRRRTVYEENVEVAKTFLENRAAPKMEKSRRKSKSQVGTNDV